MPPITGSPAITSKPSLGTIAVVEKALPDIFWQPVQWHAIVTITGLVMAKRILPQRQPPSIGSVGRVMGAPSCWTHAPWRVRIGGSTGEKHDAVRNPVADLRAGRFDLHRVDRHGRRTLRPCSAQPAERDRLC